MSLVAGSRLPPAASGLPGGAVLPLVRSCGSPVLHPSSAAGDLLCTLSLTLTSLRAHGSRASQTPRTLCPAIPGAFDPGRPDPLGRVTAFTESSEISSSQNPAVTQAAGCAGAWLCVCTYTHMPNGETPHFLKTRGRLIRTPAGGIMRAHEGVLCLSPARPTATPRSELVRQRYSGPTAADGPADRLRPGGGGGGGGGRVWGLQPARCSGLQVGIARSEFTMEKRGTMAGPRNPRRPFRAGEPVVAADYTASAGAVGARGLSEDGRGQQSASLRLSFPSAPPPH